MTRDEIFGKVRDVLVDALAVDSEEVVPAASLRNDLGAESIDMLDIGFKLERTFGFKIGQGELFPEGVDKDPKFVQAGKITPEGMAALKAKLPHVDFATLERDPLLSKVPGIFTVDTLVSFVANKLQAA